MRVAIVHHWFVAQGGGERVAEVFAGLYPQADVFTLVADPAYIPEGITGRRLTTSFLQGIPGSRKIHRHLLPLYPLAVEQLDLTAYDLVISSDSGPMKGVITHQDAIHICYCHSPMRYLWDAYHSYLKTMPAIARIPFALAAHYVRNWDYSAAQRVTHFIANSEYVARRIQHFYGRDSTVLYPPIDTHLGSISNTTDDYYLAVGRLVPYKKTEILIEACNRLGRRLRIVGTGPESAQLRSLAGPTIEFLGRVSAETLWQLYSRCRALLFAAEEDFGMVPLECQACGRPVIAYGRGGALESVKVGAPLQPDGSPAGEDDTGIFFYHQTASAVADAILSFESSENHFSPQAIRQHACQFDTELFIDRMSKLVSRWCESPAESSVPLHTGGF